MQTKRKIIHITTLTYLIDIMSNNHDRIENIFNLFFKTTNYLAYQFNYMYVKKDHFDKIINFPSLLRLK